ncbi:hypothetical protein [Embleya sp. NPDC020630]
MQKVRPQTGHPHRATAHPWVVVVADVVAVLAEAGGDRELTLTRFTT